ncbi:hypothetical protein [Acinetobacter sp. ANC 4558]|uniref:hypothetical protein n=1 Tax=Acinetobacter sp. ANC 4558 TaxID=1977876 RepID=UPI00111C5B5C|nr:hypothetical protein [Acinetobacter sp. ANC 4558]
MQKKLINFIGQMAFLGSIIVSMNVLAKSPSDSKSLESVVESQCIRELNDSRVWRNALLMKSQQEQTATKRSVCQCVNQEVMQDSSVKALSGTFNETEHRDLVSKAVLKSLRTCAQQILN